LVLAIYAEIMAEDETHASTKYLLRYNASVVRQLPDANEDEDDMPFARLDPLVLSMAFADIEGVRLLLESESVASSDMSIVLTPQVLELLEDAPDIIELLVDYGRPTSKKRRSLNTWTTRDEL
jgi:hypothetical protein